MGENSAISWATHTQNFWIGCTRVSPGCDHCYAADLSERYGWARWGRGEPRKRTAPANWRKPYQWERQALVSGARPRVFCSSLADFFDAEVPAEWRTDAWQVIRETPHLDWLLLTKRPNLIRRYLPADWGDGWPNVWLGTTVEHDAARWRIGHLVQVPAIVHFLSCEPLIAPLDLAGWAVDYDGPISGDVTWIIAGGESGSGHRPMDPQWAVALLDVCRLSGAAFWFKQSSGPRPGMGATLYGVEYHELPRVVVPA